MADKTYFKRVVFPFTAIVGQEKMKKALILNAINPQVGGVLVRGEKGTGKSTAVRALAELLPEIEVVKGCPFNCNPTDISEMCPQCRERVLAVEGRPGAGVLKGEKRRIRVVDLPLGSTEDRVLGSLDIETAIKEGKKALEPGILADVHRGILYVDEINLLDDHVVHILLDSANSGVNVLEREGISYNIICPFAGGAQAPSFCNKVQTGSTVTLKVANVITDMGDRFVMKAADSGVEIYNNVGVSAYASDLPSKGSASAYIKGSIKEGGRDAAEGDFEEDATDLYETITFSDSTAISGDITSFAKAMSYRSLLG